MSMFQNKQQCLGCLQTLIHETDDTKISLLTVHLGNLLCTGDLGQWQKRLQASLAALGGNFEQSV